MGNFRSEASLDPLVWVKANKRIWLNLVPAWRPRSAVGGCGSNEGCRVDLSYSEVKANNAYAQDPSNTQGVDAPVTGSLRVRQPYGDKDEVRRSWAEVVDRVGI